MAGTIWISWGGGWGRGGEGAGTTGSAGTGAGLAASYESVWLLYCLLFGWFLGGCLPRFPFEHGPHRMQ